MIKKIKEIWNSHVEMLRIQKELRGLKIKPRKEKNNQEKNDKL